MRPTTVHIDGPVHVADYGGEGRPVVLVHGLGGHHVNWHDVGARLTSHGHVLAPDLVGFGYTDPRGRSSGVLANRNMLLRYVNDVLGEPAVLVGNSMGGLVCMLAAARAPWLVDRLVLVCPAVPARRTVREVEPFVAMMFAIYLVPGLAEGVMTWRRKRLGPERVMREVLRLCTVDPRRVSQAAIDAHLDVARERASFAWASGTFLQATRSMVWLLARRGHMERAIDAVKAPTLIVHGEKDRLVSLADVRAVAARRPDWALEVLRDVGHIPQLEAPDRFVDVVGRWLEQGSARSGASP